MVSSAVEFTDAHSFFSDGDVSRPGVNPATGVVVSDAVAFDLSREMRVPAEDAVDVAGLGIGNCTGGDLRLETQPARVQPVEVAGKGLAPMIELLDARVQQFTHAADQRVVGNEAIELMAVDGEMALALVFPRVALVDRNPDEMRHHV